MDSIHADPHNRSIAQTGLEDGISENRAKVVGGSAKRCGRTANAKVPRMVRDATSEGEFFKNG
jgi:hypothetical protein